MSLKVKGGPMNFNDIAGTAAAVVLSLGGGGAIVLGLAKYLGKYFADRGLEKQKQEFAQLNLAFQNQLDIATRRLQIELDALGLVHRLRTQEEFSRLSELWKRISNLRRYFGGIAPQGVMIRYQDPEVQKRSDAQMREKFEEASYDAQSLLSEEALFIPKPICDIAQKALNAGAEEKFNFAVFSHSWEQGTIRSQVLIRSMTAT